MMKGPRRTVVAVREPDGNTIEDMKESHAKEKCKLLGWPVIRGAVNLVESMLTGYKALMFSAEKSGMTELEEEEDEKKAAEKREKKAARLSAKTGRDKAEILAELEQKEKEKTENGALMGVIMAIASVLGVALALFLFMWLPATLFDGLRSMVGRDISNWRALFEGVLKMAIFVGYVAAVSLMKEIKRVFMYHGAEHKTIFVMKPASP